MNDTSGIASLARPEIRALEPYRPRPRPDGVLIDNNESPYSPPDVAGDLALDMNRYPVTPSALRKRMADYYGVDEAQLLLTRGSDDGIDALLRTFCRAGEDGIIVTPPTFGMYAVAAQVQGAMVREIPLEDDFSYPVDAVTAAFSDTTALADSTRLVFACSPNNPTGKAVPLADIRKLCVAAHGKAIVVVDEAYGEFMAQDSAATLLDEFNNLAVLRTASKGLALAGARLGALLANAELLDLVQRVLPPYPLPTPTLEAAMRVFADGAIDIARRRACELVERRAEISEVLAGMPNVIRVWPSDANYLLVEFDDVQRVAERLSGAGVVVRAFTAPRLANALRISIGTASEMRCLLDVLADAE